MKKILALVLAAFIVCAATIGCTGGETKSTTTTVTTSSKAK